MGEQELVRGVAEEPFEDGPRLVLADWWEEHGQDVPCGRCVREAPYVMAGEGGNPDCPACRGTGRASDGRRERAEFVRVQCELAGLLIPWAEASMGVSYTYADAGPGLHVETSRFDRYQVLRRREGELLTRERAVLWAEPVGSQIGYQANIEPAKLPWEFRRGFVAEVSLPLEAWAGGECPRCDGTGLVGPVNDRDTPCPDCPDDHPGRTPALGPRLVRAAPVEAVRLTDREPYYNGAGYGWFRQSRRRPSDSVPESAVLPDDVFDQLNGWLVLTPSGHRISGRRYRVYALTAIAQDALSRASIDWARGEHPGLPPLPPLRWPEVARTR